MRSATSEHPGRFALIDTDGSDASEEALDSALALGATEAQLALREGKALVARLAEAKGDQQEPSDAPSIDPEKTILITGATGGLGSLLARHLVERHGAQHLLLLSRSGPKTKGAKELAAELGELGAKAKITSCDVADRKALQKALSLDPPRAPPGRRLSLRRSTRRRHDRVPRATSH